MNAEQLKVLGERFVKLSVMFLAFIEKNKLDETYVDMSEGRDMREPDKPICETPLCHGGWLAVMFESEKLEHPSAFLPPQSKSFYIAGAREAARFLGFVDGSALRKWADQWPNIWGNLFGYQMFAAEAAFGDDLIGVLKLSDIAKHYAAVGQRCLEASKKPYCSRLANELFSA